MKHMWSEEELQALIEEQGGSGGGSGGSTLDDIVDSKGNKRFIEGNGLADAEGMIAKSTKWVLNGSDLIIELAGSFMQDILATTPLAYYELPEWISNKITPLATVDGSGFITPFTSNIATTEKSVDIQGALLKMGNMLIFTLINNLSVSTFNGVPAFFRFTCHLIIDTK